jgi:hypothetical protein
VNSDYQFTYTIEATKTSDTEAQLTFSADIGDCTNNGLHNSACHYKMVGTATISPP